MVKEIITHAEDNAPIPKSSQDVFVLYEGKLENGKVFDKCDDLSNPFKFQLGKSQVIKGWDIGVATMKKGEKSILYLKSEYAYGDSGAGNDIPPHSNLIFTVELIDFMDRAKSKHEMTKEEKVEDAKKLKNDGNTFFKEGKFDAAISKFESASDYLKSEIKDLNDEETQLYCTCLVNTSICSNKIGNYVKAINSASNALKTQITQKAVYQRGLAYANNASDDDGLLIANEDLMTLTSLAGNDDPAVLNLRDLINGKKKQIMASKKSLSKALFTGGLYTEKGMPEVEKVISIPETPTKGNPIVYMDLKYK